MTTRTMKPQGRKAAAASTAAVRRSRLRNVRFQQHDMPFAGPPFIERPGAGAQMSARPHLQRRRLNVVVAAIGFVITLPLMILIALVVKATSRGPVFYEQQRVGLDMRANRGPGSLNGRRRHDSGGRVFTIYKFRTMTVREEEAGGQEWATADDPRITAVGAVLRKYRLDELPQFLNVLKGDMNVVGPRPEQPEIFHKLRGELPGYTDRQRVLPGITGWAQVNQRSDRCLDDVKAKVDLDSEYIRRHSAGEDLMIMARTIPVMLGKIGSA